MAVNHDPNKARNKSFLGRDQELSYMKSLLVEPGIRALHVYGPGGIGKSSLLQQLCQEYDGCEAFIVHQTDKAAVHFVHVYPEIPGDSRSSSRSIPIDEMGEFINLIASRCEMSLLIIDPFDQWMPCYDWITARLVPLLASNVRILSASRFPLEIPWELHTRQEQTMIHNMELKPFDQTTSFRFIESFGIHDISHIHMISKVARGFPFAIQTISLDILRENIDVLSSRRYKTQFYQKAVMYQLQDVRLTQTQAKILDAASLLWSFDYDLITHLLQHEVTINAFRKFCELPFIKLTSDGWQINSSIRYWFRKEFSFRSPDTHDAYQDKARPFLLKRLHQRPPAERSELYLQLLHLIDKEILHMYCFLESFDEFDIRPLPQQELPAARQMFVSFHENVPGFFPDMTRQEFYLETYWEMSPDTFCGFYKSNQLVLFVTGLPLTPAIRKELINNPTYSNYIKRSTYQENELVMWIASFLPDFGSSAIGLAFMYGYSRFAPNSLMTVIAPFPEAHQLMDSMGFQRLVWGDYVSQEGVEYKAYQLDLREGLLSERFRATEGTTLPVSVLSRTEAIEHTKKLLHQFHQFEEDESFMNACPYLNNYARSKNERIEEANKLRKEIQSIINEWSNGTGLNVTYGTILNMCYIQKSGNHESVAIRLNMSPSTYYRNLKKAIAKMSDALSEFRYQ
ncbi:DUF1492 domain-containing protein [Paenibacillus spongiae]|uniref:DUF1492 domain-containing protein n=1 Tax=Paenibacillus spongiae TaxID=2909671 RepID=A0ABY5S0R3_9BACL|nr:DUF1492 domain-containing protein [Paenibacillus spongiae]UVI27441.1 DUF1492 domain-containing protein [Paenibacillus spongiae]